MTTPAVDEHSALGRYLSHNNDDAGQAGMMGETLIRVNARDQVLGAVSKYEAHRGAGLLHRAFSVLLFNSQRELLLQRRADSKITFPGVWANSCCSHPLFTAEEQDERQYRGVKRAAIRKMAQELGVPSGNLQEKDFILMTRVHYHADSEDAWAEEEMDYILVTRANITLQPNPNEVADVRWVTPAGLRVMLDDPALEFAPWFRIIATRLLPKWWPAIKDLQALRQLSDNRIHHY